MLRPQSGAQQLVLRDEYIIEPNVPVSEYMDEFGNLCQRLIAPVGQFNISTQAEVETTEIFDTDSEADFIEVQNLPEYTLKYLLPSRYCESDRFSLLAHSIVEDTKLGYCQVDRIEKWLIDNIHYIPGSSEYPISAVEVNQRGWGVCRDLAHLGISLCRSINIPARMVVGYLHELYPMDMHAWFEAFVGDRWYTFDATQKKNKGGYVAVGYGRDAADLAVYNQFGPAVFPLEQVFTVELLQ